MAITQKELERAIAIVTAFNAGKETKMSTKKAAIKKDIVSVLTAAGLKLSRVTATTAGKTGFGVEFEVAEMNRKGDISLSVFKDIRAIYNYMKADFEEVDGEKVRTRNCFFYLGFPTKKERDAEVKRLSALLLKEEKPAPKKSAAKKAEPKKSAPKKAEPKKATPKKAEPKKAEPSAKELLLGLAKNMTADEKAELLRALFA